MFLHDCLNSVLNQKFKPCELICVNDGSTDNSLAILEDFARKAPIQVKVFSQLNIGLSETRNKALEIATGNYILFLDSDDMLIKGSLRRLSELITKERPDIVAFNSEIYYTNQNSADPNHHFNHSVNKVFINGMTYFEAFVKSKGWGPSAVCFYMFKRELIINNHLRFKVGLLHEDELFLPQLLYFAGKTYTLNSILYRYRINRESITHTITCKNYLDKLSIAEMLFDFFIDKRIVNKYVNQSIYNLMLAGIHGLMYTDSGWEKTKIRSLKILMIVAHSAKEKMIAAMIRIDVNLYRLYYNVVKKLYDKKSIALFSQLL